MAQRFDLVLDVAGGGRGRGAYMPAVWRSVLIFLARHHLGGGMGRGRGVGPRGPATPADHLVAP
eukprot:5836311-Lingulodinium_polyedra.AAC.1